ncbi:MAG: PTS sugar transporter subunit IIB [Thermoprotei archaeon]
MKKLKVVVACGMGMGTVFIIKTNVETVLRELGIPAEVIPTNISSLSVGPDVDLLVVSKDFEKILKDKPVPKIFLVNLLDRNELKQKLVEKLKEMGYLS